MLHIFILSNLLLLNPTYYVLCCLVIRPLSLSFKSNPFRCCFMILEVGLCKPPFLLCQPERGTRATERETGGRQVREREEGGEGKVGGRGREREEERDRKARDTPSCLLPVSVSKAPADSNAPEQCSFSGSGNLFCKPIPVAVFQHLW